MPIYLGIRSKIYLALSGLLFLFALALFLFIKFEYAKHLRHELEKRGVSIARHIAGQSINAVLSRDPLSLKSMLKQTRKTEEDIDYIFFLDPQGELLAHTFGEEFPVELLQINPLPEQRAFKISQLDTETGPIYDVVVPLGNGGLGQVHLGMSALPVSQSIRHLTQNIVWMTLALAGGILLIGLPLVTAISRPLRRLTAATNALAAGSFDHLVPEKGGDEISTLGKTFNRMTKQLATAQQELLDRNRSLENEIKRRLDIEKQLDSQLSFLATLLNEIPEPLFYKDTSGRFIGCNRALENFYDRPRQQIIGRSVFDILPEAEAKRHNEADQGLFAHPGTCQYEGAITAASAVVRHAIFKKTTFTDSSGELAGLLGLILDVTPEREVERLRREFVSTTAHEFQTPLAAILGFCELLQQPEGEILGDRDEFIAIIQERAEFLSRLVDQFLDVGRIEAGRGLEIHPHPCHPQTLIEKVLRNNRMDNRKRFELHFPPHCPQVLVDEDRLIQVFDNLLSNAVKYSPPEGSIIISGEVDGTFLRINVDDQGPGLASEHQSRIFDKFYRVNLTESSPSGTGLGLFITRAIIAAHGGQIAAGDAPGKGTRITFTLPLA